MELCFHNTVKMYSRYKIREYQYKYFMKMTPNDNFLYKCKLVNSRLCNFCAMAPGTYTYLFLGMSYSPKVLDWFEFTFYYQRNYYNRTISIGIKTEKDLEKRNIMNYIHILAKYFISKCKYSAINRDIISFQGDLTKRRETKRIIPV